MKIKNQIIKDKIIKDLLIFSCDIFNRFICIISIPYKEYYYDIT